jgi:alpha-1,2-mannosyltransferase
VVVLKLGNRRTTRRTDLLADLAILLGVVAFCRGANLVHELYYHEVFVDLDVYRLGGRALLDHQPLYDLKLIHTNLPFTYTPFAAIFFIPLSLLDHNPAVLVWTSLSLVLLLRICWIVATEVRRRAEGTWPTGLLAFALFLVALEMEPMLETIGFGQINLVIMWMVLEDVLRRRPNRASGVMLGLATGIKLVPGLFIVFLLVTRRTREALTAAAATLGTIALGFIVRPDQASRYWGGIAYDGTRMGEFFYVANQSINGVLYRFMPPEGSRLVWMAISAPIVGLAMWTARRLWSHDLKLLGVSTIALASVLVSPISWSHHWIWFLIVLAALLDAQAGPRVLRVLAFAGTFVVSTVHFVWSAPRGLIWSVPHGDGAEHTLEGVDKYLANAYVWLGLALLGLAVWAALALGPSGSSTLDRTSDDLDEGRHADEPADALDGLEAEDGATVPV